MSKTRAILFAFIVGVLVIAAYFYSVGGIPGSIGRGNSPGVNGAAGGAKGTLSPEAVLSIAPRPHPTAMPGAPARKLSPTLQEFYEAKSYASLYARLAKSTSRTSEEQWMLAEILSHCAKVAEHEPERFKPWKLGGPDARTRFAASLAPNDPDREKRLAAFDGVNYDKCADISSVETTRKEIRELLAAGAAAGDPKASASLVQHDIESVYYGADGKMKFGPDTIARISDSQVDTLKQAMASGDPFAVRIAVSTLMGAFQNMSLRDADDRPLSAGALYMASQLLGCDYGFNCGADSQMILTGCAFQGYCAANNTRDYLMYYQSSPNSSQMVAGYEAGLRNIVNNNDWTSFHVFPGPNPVTAAYQGPRSP